MYQALAMAFFGTADYEPEAQLWWQIPNNTTNIEWERESHGNGTHVYPLPQRLANLLRQGDSVDYKTLAHPSFLHGITTEQLIKMFKFGMWAEYMVRTGNFDTPSDVIKAELDVFEKRGYNLREDFQV